MTSSTVAQRLDDSRLHSSYMFRATAEGAGSRYSGVMSQIRSSQSPMSAASSRNVAGPYSTIARAGTIVPVARSAPPERRGAGRGAQHSSASRASSRSATNAGWETVSRRGGAAREGRVEGAHDPARPRREHDDAAGEQQRLLDVVGHQEDRPRHLVQRADQPLLHLGAGDRVERAEGLVEEEDVLLGHERPQEADPLAHPARELRRLRDSN